MFTAAFSATGVRGRHGGHQRLFCSGEIYRHRLDAEGLRRQHAVAQILPIVLAGSARHAHPEGFRTPACTKCPQGVQSFPPEFPYTKPWPPPAPAPFSKGHAGLHILFQVFQHRLLASFPCIGRAAARHIFFILFHRRTFARARPLRRRSPGTHSGTWGTQRALHASLAPTAALFQKGQGPGCTARRRPRPRGQQNRGRFAARGKPWMPMLRPGAQGKAAKRRLPRLSA